MTLLQSSITLPSDFSGIVNLIASPGEITATLNFSSAPITNPVPDPVSCGPFSPCVYSGPDFQILGLKSTPGTVNEGEIAGSEFWVKSGVLLSPPQISSPAPLAFRSDDLTALELGNFTQTYGRADNWVLPTLTLAFRVVFTLWPFPWRLLGWRRKRKVRAV